jgi:hypothetical protein
MAMKDLLRHFLYVHYVLLNISVNPIPCSEIMTQMLIPVRNGQDRHIRNLVDFSIQRGRKELNSQS